MTTPLPAAGSRAEPGDALRSLVAGTDQQVPVADGSSRTYVNFDNAASTPPFRAVLDRVNAFAAWYSNVHRGTGFKSRLSSWAFDEVRRAVHGFLGSEPDHDVVVFTRNTTEAINRLARTYPFDQDAVVLVTMMEHHSNDLPWRRVAKVVHVRTGADGVVDAGDFEAKLATYRGRVALVAVSGASNVTGVVNPVHTFARRAHEAGAKIVVDAAQLAPHRPIDVRPPEDPEHLDFVAFSAHKMYAPFGVGVLVGPRDAFLRGDPADAGGGTVEIVSLDRVVWTGLPEREEAGTPCIVGVVALGAALEVYREVGWVPLVQHEARLTSYALERLASVPGLVQYGDPAPARAEQRLGVISFNLGDLPHGLVAAILSHEWGIGTRSGCFCAHPYVKALLGIDEAAALALERMITRGDRSRIPGAVRVSFGIYNEPDEIDRLAEALAVIAAGHHLGDYVLDPVHGDYQPAGVAADFSRYFQL